MKAIKRIVCLTLAIVMAGLAFVMPVSAAGATPLIMIDGIGTTKLYKNFGTAKEELIFSGDDAFVEKMVKDIGGALFDGFIRFGLGKKDYEALAKKILPTVNEYVKDLGFKPDGTPVDPTVGFYRTEKPLSEYTKKEKEGISTFAKAYAKKHGSKYVYNFTYDWRDDPVKIADELNTFIKNIKAKTNCKRLNMVAMSMGSTIALSYLNKYGGSSLKNIVFAAPAWQGTSIVGNVLTNNLKIDIFAVENYLVQLANGSATTHIAATFISYLASDEGLSREYFAEFNEFATGLLPYTYTETFLPYFAGMPGLWSLCPAEDYEDAKDFIFDSHDVKINAAYEKKIDKYHRIQVNAKKTIKNVLRDGANFYIVCGYNCQIVPISEEYYSSDGVIDTEYMSGGATCAKYLQSGKDWGRLYTQKIKDGHNHVSWDAKVDASTCMFPEYTWFIKNQQHNNYMLENGTMDIVLWLLGSSKRVTVTTDVKNYPQFWLHNTYKRTSKPMEIDEVLGDLNNSSAVNTVDARIALKLASGQATPTDAQLIIGDIDEDGKFTTEDARAILCFAAGLPC